MIRVLLLFGTRPEAIKLCPLIRTLRQQPDFSVKICVTGQHRQLLNSVLEVFDILPDYDLSVMAHGQTPTDVMAAILANINQPLTAADPDIVLVHGDTTTALAATLACFYASIPVGHVEAGLRTPSLLNPFPEEFHRRCIGMLSSLHFAPTARAKNNLINEGADRRSIFLTGNTGIDVLKYTIRPDFQSPHLTWAQGSRLILLTTHRRENQGATMRSMLHGIKQAVMENPDTKLLFPAHPNPAVQEACSVLAGCDRIRIVEPLDVISFHNIMARAHLILTDSGGIQEEAPALGRPVLVMRQVTERQEGLRTGNLRLIGTDGRQIYEALTRLLQDKRAYGQMAQVAYPYGDGHASARIMAILRQRFSKNAVHEELRHGQKDNSYEALTSNG